MPKPAAQVAPVPPLTYFPDESGLPSEDAGNVHLGNSQTERDPRSQHPPNQERQSFWSKCRKSFGPFSRPSFIPPTPTPNLAALRGITVPKAFRPGILKRQVPGRTGNSDANEQEVLEDEEAIGPRHIPRQVDAGHTIADIPYVPRAQEQRRWI